MKLWQTWLFNVPLTRGRREGELLFCGLVPQVQNSVFQVTGMIKGFLGFIFSIPVYICVAWLKWGRFIDKVPNCITAVWWPRTAIRNFLDNSRKFNFCNRLILKLLHFFSIKKILKMYFLFFKDNLFLKRLNSFDFWKYYKLFLKR